MGGVHEWSWLKPRALFHLFESPETALFFDINMTKVRHCPLQNKIVQLISIPWSTKKLAMSTYMQISKKIVILVHSCCGMGVLKYFFFKTLRRYFAAHHWIFI